MEKDEEAKSQLEKNQQSVNYKRLSLGPPFGSKTLNTHL